MLTAGGAHNGARTLDIEQSHAGGSSGFSRAGSQRLLPDEQGARRAAMLGRRIWSDSAVRRLVRMAAAIALLVALAVALPAGATSSSKHTTSSGAIVPGFN